MTDPTPDPKMDFHCACGLLSRAITPNPGMHAVNYCRRCAATIFAEWTPEGHKPPRKLVREDLARIPPHVQAEMAAGKQAVMDEILFKHGVIALGGPSQYIDTLGTFCFFFGLEHRENPAMYERVMADLEECGQDVLVFEFTKIAGEAGVTYTTERSPTPTSGFGVTFGEVAKTRERRDDHRHSRRRRRLN